MNYVKISEAGYANFTNQLKYCASSLKADLLCLIYLRVSQINECPYCINFHFAEAMELKIDPKKLNLLQVWHSSELFNKKECAALEFAESITLLDSNDYEEQIAELKGCGFSEKEVVDLAFAIANMNAMNRVAIACGREPR